MHQISELSYLPPVHPVQALQTDYGVYKESLYINNTDTKSSIKVIQHLIGLVPREERPMETLERGFESLASAIRCTLRKQIPV